MSRVRLSTTVDADRLARSRKLLGVKDSELIDRALRALLAEVEHQREREALERYPYEGDPELSWETAPGFPLPYEGPVPADLIELARERRRGATR